MTRIPIITRILYKHLRQKGPQRATGGRPGRKLTGDLLCPHFTAVDRIWIKVGVESVVCVCKIDQQFSWCVHARKRVARLEM